MFEASIVLMIVSGIVLIMRLSHLQRMDEIRALSGSTKDQD
jgi:hypothetical protein